MQTQQTNLFTPLHIQNQTRKLSIKNRIIMPPMDQYRAKDGLPNQWHMQHYTQRALGGVGLIIIESTSILPHEAMISNQDLGLWDDAHISPLQEIIQSCQSYGAKVAIQLNHAGRKSETTTAPFGPSPIAFGELPTPKELSINEIQSIIKAFGEAAKRAVSAGVDAIEIHAAHGYLISSFLSPLSNQRSDAYGTNRAQFLAEVLESIHQQTNHSLPIILRISASDWMENGNTPRDFFDLLHPLSHLYDAIDVSSGGVVMDAKIPAYPGFQIHLAYEIKTLLNKPTFGGGFIVDAKMANYIVSSGACDGVYLGKELLRNPFFAFGASRTLNLPLEIPFPYSVAQ